MASTAHDSYATYHRGRLAGRLTFVITGGAGAYLVYLLAGGWEQGYPPGHVATVVSLLATFYLSRSPRWALASILGLSLSIAVTALWLDATFAGRHPAWIALAIVGLSALSPLPRPAREAQTAIWVVAIMVRVLFLAPDGSPLDVAALFAATGVAWLVSWVNTTHWKNDFENLEVQRQLSGRLGDARDTLERAVQKTREELAAQQARVVQNERLATLGRLAAGIAHEINNPLTVAITNLDLAAADRDPALLDDARSSLRRIRNIVSDLTRVARPGDIEYVETVPLEPILAYASDVVRIVVKGQMRIRSEAAADALVSANRGRLEQVLVNLFMNAWQAMAPRGSGEVLVTTQIVGSTLHVVVDDDGPGIPVELVDEIFEPFFTTKPVGEGSGLGLAISRSYMQAMGGDLRVRRRGTLGGAQFIVVVPLPGTTTAHPVRTPAPSEPRPAETRDVSADETRPPSILVIDDEPGLRRSLARALRREWQVHTAANGAEALTKFRDEPIDVVLCDLVLADEAGIEVLQSLAARRPEILRHTLLMTGEPGSTEWVEIARRNQASLVRKPFDLGELARRLREARVGHSQPLLLEP